MKRRDNTLIVRTMAGLEKARKEERVGGRPKVITDRGKMNELRAAGKSLPAIAREMNLSIECAVGSM